MTKYQLEVTYDYSMLLIGISCHAKDYRLCWAVNQQLGLKLEKAEDDIEIIHKPKNRTSAHSVYHYFDEENHTEYTLVQNKGDVGFLVPEQHQADYFLLIRDNFDNELTDMIAKLRGIDFILMAFEVDPNALKSKENLIF